MDCGGGLLSLLIAFPLISWRGRGVTNYELAGDIQSRFPKSFRYLQDILVVTKKNSKDENIKMLNELKEILYQESEDSNTKPGKQQLDAFIEEFSYAFPNWQEEYSILKNLISEK